ncbi:MAG: hypothetical protein WA324_00560 [Bryobacteraceae bacterium]
MATPTIDEKIAVFDTLFFRVQRVARAMGGSAEGINEPVAHHDPPIPRADVVPALLVEMPGGFLVKLVPAFPLRAPGNALSVRAERTHNGGRKTDWQFTHGPDGWRGRQGLLTDDEIRACLTPEGPPPAVY